MIMSVAEALNAYRATAKGADMEKDGLDNVSGASGFGDMLGKMLGDSIGNIKNAENVSMAAVQGKASINEVVAAVSSAEVALQTVVSIRDRLIGAYQELMRSGV